MGRWNLSGKAFIIRSAMFKCQRLSLIICLIIEFSESPFTSRVEVRATEYRKHLVEGK